MTAPDAAFRKACALVLVAWVLSVLLAWSLPDVWPRMAVNGAVLVVWAAASSDVEWRALFRPTLGHLVTGLGAAILLYGVGKAVFTIARELPGIESQVASIERWRTAVEAPLVVPVLVFIIFCEEIVWRCAVTLPLAARLGEWPGAMAAATGFAVAHIALGLPLVVIAAFGAGLFWSGLVVKTRSAVPALVCHLLWDLAVLLWFPYTRG